MDQTGLAPCRATIPKLSESRWVGGQPGQCLVVICLFLCLMDDGVGDGDHLISRDPQAREDLEDRL